MSPSQPNGDAPASVVLDANLVVLLVAPTAEAGPGICPYPRLGLTEAGLPGLVSRDTPFVTVDLDLYLAASAADALSTVNYRHLQAQHA